MPQFIVTVKLLVATDIEEVKVNGGDLETEHVFHLQFYIGQDQSKINAVCMSFRNGV